LKTGFVSTPGTNIEAGIEEALNSFADDVESQRFVVLLSDGGSTLGDIERAAEAAAERYATVLSIGIGGEKLVPIPLADGGQVTDARGETVETRLQERDLIRISESTGGRFFTMNNPGVIGSVVDTVRDLSYKRLTKGFRLVSTVRYRTFLFGAFLLILIYQGVRIFRWKGSF
jgi:Ca-activated chloride channel family protein